MKLIKLVFVGAACVYITACSNMFSKQYVKDSVPADSVIADAVPKYEPITKRGNKTPYVIFGKTYKLRDVNAHYKEQGKASWYGSKFHGLKTANGEPYNMYAMTAAHKTLRIPCYVRVTNLVNGKKTIVRVNDRGPFVDGRIIDLSYVAAKKLGILKQGTGDVEVEIINTNNTAMN